MSLFSKKVIPACAVNLDLLPPIIMVERLDEKTTGFTTTVPDKEAAAGACDFQIICTIDQHNHLVEAIRLKSRGMI